MYAKIACEVQIGNLERTILVRKIHDLSFVNMTLLEVDSVKWNHPVSDVVFACQEDSQGKMSFSQ